MIHKRRIFLFLTILLLVSCHQILDEIPPSQKSGSVLPSELPQYLGFVLPEINSTYSTSQYAGLAPSLGGWGATEPGVCFSIWAYFFIEDGDAPTTEEWLSRISFFVDDQEIIKYQSLLTMDTQGRVKTDPGSQEVIWKEPNGSPFGLCYAIELGPGDHVARMRVEKRSGTFVEFSWFFKIR